MKKSAESRKEMLQANGINTGSYFSVELPAGLKPGASISLVINDNGLPEFVPMDVMDMEIGGCECPCCPCDDEIINGILENGYVRNTRLHRRWVMAQMFRALNWNSRYWGKGYNDYINNIYPYAYQFKMTQEEIRVISILQQEDMESFVERTQFFNFDVVIAMYKDYLNRLEKWINELDVKNCKGVPYKTIKGNHIFISDLEKKVYAPVRRFITRITNLKCTGNYHSLYIELMKFNTREMIHLPSHTMKSSAWKDAYKGAGAYYTLKNMIMFHGCFVPRIHNPNFIVYGEGALQVLKAKTKEYQGEYWRLFAFMNKVIEDNKFDFDARMREIYSKKPHRTRYDW